MTRFLVCLLVCGAWCGAGVGRERALTPTPLPLRRRGALERYFFPATLRVAFLAPAFFAGAFLAALRGAAFFAALRGAAFFVAFLSGAFLARSEEHTSELQSLMRISYTVFCLQKKKIQSLTIQT